MQILLFLLAVINIISFSVFKFITSIGLNLGTPRKKNYEMIPIYIKIGLLSSVITLSLFAYEAYAGSQLLAGISVLFWLIIGLIAPAPTFLTSFILKKEAEVRADSEPDYSKRLLNIAESLSIKEVI